MQILTSYFFFLHFFDKKCRQILPNGTLYFPPFAGTYYRADVHENIYRCKASNQAGTILSRDVHVSAGTYTYAHIVDHKMQCYFAWRWNEREKERRKIKSPTTIENIKEIPIFIADFVHPVHISATLWTIICHKATNFMVIL